MIFQVRSRLTKKNLVKSVENALRTELSIICHIYVPRATIFCCLSINMYTLIKSMRKIRIHWDKITIHWDPIKFHEDLSTIHDDQKEKI